VEVLSHGQSLGIGVDLGKAFHWAHVLDASGREILSRKLENDEAYISRSSSMSSFAWRMKSYGH
jgi:hypothetical protein